MSIASTPLLPTAHTYTSAELEKIASRRYCCIKLGLYCCCPMKCTATVTACTAGSIIAMISELFFMFSCGCCAYFQKTPIQIFCGLLDTCPVYFTGTLPPETDLELFLFPLSIKIDPWSPLSQKTTDYLLPPERPKIENSTHKA